MDIERVHNLYRPFIEIMFSACASFSRKKAIAYLFSSKKHAQVKALKGKMDLVSCHMEAMFFVQLL